MTRAFAARMSPLTSTQGNRTDPVAWCAVVPAPSSEVAAASELTWAARVRWMPSIPTRGWARVVTQGSLSLWVAEFVWSGGEGDVDGGAGFRLSGLIPMGCESIGSVISQPAGTGRVAGVQAEEAGRRCLREVQFEGAVRSGLCPGSECLGVQPDPFRGFAVGHCTVPVRSPWVSHRSWRPAGSASSIPVPRAGPTKPLAGAAAQPRRLPVGLPARRARAGASHRHPHADEPDDA